MLADRAAAAAAVAARAAESGGVAVKDRVHVPHLRDLAGLTGLGRQRPLMVRSYPEAEPLPEPEFEPWNPEATYDSLVLLLTELKALHPQEVAVLPTKPSRRGAVRRSVSVLVASALVLGAAVTFVATHRSGPSAPAAVAPPRTSTVLVAIETNGTVQGATLLARRVNRTQEVLLPSRLLVDVPGQGTAQLADAPSSGPGATADAISNALQVRVDGTWVLDRTSLAALVDAEGGVDVTLTDDILPTDGSVAVDLGVGTSHITGAQAASLALAIGSQEPEASRLARQQILLEAVLAKLPTDPGHLLTLLQKANLNGTITPTSLATMLGGVRADVVAGRAASILVPTNEIDSGSGTPSYGLDDKAAAAMVDERLPGAEFPVPPGGRARILVQNGVGRPGLGAAARAELVPRGYIFRGGGNATSFANGPSVVLIPDSSAESRAVGTAVARILGLPSSSVELDSTQTTIADVVVILGSDFTPKTPPTP